jgi:hypothetical protein
MRDFKRQDFGLKREDFLQIFYKAGISQGWRKRLRCAWGDKIFFFILPEEYAS